MTPGGPNLRIHDIKETRGALSHEAGVFIQHQCHSDVTTYVTSRSVYLTQQRFKQLVSPTAPVQGCGVNGLWGWGHFHAKALSRG